MGILTSLPAIGQVDSAAFHASCHCMSNLTPAGVMISHLHPKGESMFSYRYMSMENQGLQSGRSQIDEMDVYNNYIMNSDKMRMDMHMLMMMYGITDRLTIMEMLNYNVNSMDMSMLTAHNHDISGESIQMNDFTMKTQGMGDAKIYLMYGLVKKIHHQLIVSGGCSLPMGSIQVLGKKDDFMYAGQRLPYMMQLGSGTFDFLSSLNYTFQQRKMAFAFQLSSVIRTSYNINNYVLGNGIGINTWYAYNWWNNFSNSIRFDISSMGKIQGRDKTVYSYNEIGSNTNNYGGQRINLFLGMAYNFNTGFIKNNRISLEYGLPLYQNINGIQLKAKSIFNVTWNYSFSTKKK